jgi:hypothetical protein
MAFYRIYVYLHILGALSLFAALASEAAGLRQLARATNLERARDALATFQSNRVLGPISALLLLIPGIYLTETVWSSHPAWVASGFVVLVLVFGLGGGVTGRRITRLGRGFAEPGADTTSAIERVMPALRASYFGRLGLLLGVTFAMVVKPELGGCVAAILCGLSVGLAASVAVTRLPAPGASRPAKA